MAQEKFIFEAGSVSAPVISWVAKINNKAGLPAVGMSGAELPANFLELDPGERQQALVDGVATVKEAILKAGGVQIPDVKMTAVAGIQGGKNIAMLVLTPPPDAEREDLFNQLQQALTNEVQVGVVPPDDEVLLGGLPAHRDAAVDDGRTPTDAQPKTKPLPRIVNGGEQRGV